MADDQSPSGFSWRHVSMGAGPAGNARRDDVAGRAGRSRGRVAGGRVGLLSMLPWQFLLSLIGGVSILGVLVQGAFWQRWWIPFVPPAVGWVLSANLVRTFFLQRKDTI